MTAALEGGEWSAARPGSTLPPGKTRYPFYRRLGGPQGRSGRAEKSRPHRDSIPDLPFLSQSLYRLSYPAHCYRASNLLLQDKEHVSPFKGSKSEVLHQETRVTRVCVCVCGPPTPLTGPSSTVRSSQISDTEQTLCIIPAVLQTTLYDACMVLPLYSQSQEVW
jgi:hypothetical protein